MLETRSLSGVPPTECIASASGGLPVPVSVAGSLAGHWKLCIWHETSSGLSFQLVFNLYLTLVLTRAKQH